MSEQHPIDDPLALGFTCNAEHSIAQAHLREAELEVDRMIAADKHLDTEPGSTRALTAATHRAADAGRAERAFRLTPYEVALVEFGQAQHERDRWVEHQDRYLSEGLFPRDVYDKALAVRERELADRRAKLARLSDQRDVDMTQRRERLTNG